MTPTQGFRRAAAVTLAVGCAWLYYVDHGNSAPVCAGSPEAPSLNGSMLGSTANVECWLPYKWRLRIWRNGLPWTTSYGRQGTQPITYRPCRKSRSAMFQTELQLRYTDQNGNLHYRMSLSPITRKDCK